MYRIAGRDLEGERMNVPWFTAMLHPSDRSLLNEIDDVVEGRLLRRMVRYRIVRPDGQVRSLQAWTEEQRADDGSLLLLHGALLDGLVEDVLVAPADDAVAALDLAGLAAAGRDGLRLVRRWCAPTARSAPSG